MDVTERQRREEEIRELRALPRRYRASASRDPRGRLDLRVKPWNPAAERIFGWTVDEILGIPVPIIPAEQEDEFQDMLDRIREGQAFTGVGDQQRAPRRTRVNVEVSAAPIRDAAGVVAGYMAVFSDISDRSGTRGAASAVTRTPRRSRDEARQKLERNLHDGAQQCPRRALRLAPARGVEAHRGPCRLGHAARGAREELMHAPGDLPRARTGDPPGRARTAASPRRSRRSSGGRPSPVEVDVCEAAGSPPPWRRRRTTSSRRR